MIACISSGFTHMKDMAVSSYIFIELHDKLLHEHRNILMQKYFIFVYSMLWLSENVSCNNKAYYRSIGNADLL